MSKHIQDAKCLYNNSVSTGRCHNIPQRRKVTCYNAGYNITLIVQYDKDEIGCAVKIVKLQ